MNTRTLLEQMRYAPEHLAGVDVVVQVLAALMQHTKPINRLTKERTL